LDKIKKLPGIKLISQYKKSWLRSDIVAGIVLTTLLVPQGMAYAELAGLPPITGLYTTVICLFGYALFGPSKILVLGPDSSLGPLIAATILPILASNGDPSQAVVLASLLSLIVGVMMVLSGIAKLGFIADLLSKPTRVGYMNGLALTILVSQLPKLFGFSTDANGFIEEVRFFIAGLVDGQTLVPSLLVGLFSISLIYGLNRWIPKIPGILLAVVSAVVVSVVFNLESKGVSVVGLLPQGLPPLTLPSISYSNLTLLIAGAFGISLVSLADTISTASAFAIKRGEEVKGNREMIGIGAANILVGLFQGFPISTSGSRTAVAERAGAKTQFTGVFAALLILVMLAGAPWLMKPLPQPVLAAIVIVASFSLADFPALKRLWYQRKSELLLSISALLGVVLVGILEGIAIAILLSVLNIFRRAWWPYTTTLGKVQGIAGHHDMKQYPEAKVTPGLVIYRFDSPLFFANANTFRDQIRKLSRSKPKWIIIASAPITDIDTTAADMLLELDKEMNSKNINLVFAAIKNPVRQKLERYELIGPLEERHFYPTIESAVTAYQGFTDTDWVDKSAKQPKT